MIMNLVVWRAVYSDRTDIQGYTFEVMTTYYLVNSVISAFQSRMAFMIWDDIRLELLPTFLLMPYSYNLSNFIEQIILATFKSITPIAVACVVYFAGSSYFSEIHNFHFAIISLILGIVINFMFYACIGNLAFWTNDVWGPVVLIANIARVLAGVMFPLDLLPDWAETASKILPFRYMNFSFISISIGRITELNLIFNEILIQLVWILMLWFLLKILWHRGLRKYEAYGH